MTLARDRGYDVVERSVVRSDLYLADEALLVTLVGSATTITPCSVVSHAATPSAVCFHRDEP
jgi:branched-subunit amino acid aminotransferase/4-amino-4-deoxychorismate lyase